MVTRKMAHSRRHSLTLKPQLHNDQTFHVLTEKLSECITNNPQKNIQGHCVRTVPRLQLPQVSLVVAWGRLIIYLFLQVRTRSHEQ